MCSWEWHTTGEGWNNILKFSVHIQGSFRGLTEIIFLILFIDNSFILIIMFLTCRGDTIKVYKSVLKNFFFTAKFMICNLLKTVRAQGKINGDGQINTEVLHFASCYIFWHFSNKIGIFLSALKNKWFCSTPRRHYDKCTVFCRGLTEIKNMNWNPFWF